MTIGERIKERREYLGMSQEELALKLGYKSRASINKIEKNGRELRQQKIAEIAELLQTTPGYIMGWEQSEKIANALNVNVTDLLDITTRSDLSTYTTKEVNIGDKIRRYRKERGLTQKELAESCGMFEPNLRKYELGKQNPKLETLEKIANALNVNVTDLLDITTRSDLSTYTTKELLEELIRRAGD